MIRRTAIALSAIAGLALLGPAAGAAPGGPATPGAGQSAVEQVQARCSQMRNVWYTYPCINGWSYICQHKSWGPGWGCRDTRRCTMRDRRCR